MTIAANFENLSVSMLTWLDDSSTAYPLNIVHSLYNIDLNASQNQKIKMGASKSALDVSPSMFIQVSFNHTETPLASGLPLLDSDVR